jgi:urease subunit alpha
MANRMKGLTREHTDEGDNHRVLRYIAKYTINPALAHGLAHEIGSLELGKLADIVLWRPALFGVKPEMVVKGGFVAWGAMGEGNASIERAQPVSVGPFFGAEGSAPGRISKIFLSAAAGEVRRHWPGEQWSIVRGASSVAKRDMIRNDAVPSVRVDPSSLTVQVDGREVGAEPAREVRMNRLYFLS